MSTPNRVREFREARGLSQIALAAVVHLTRQSVGAIEAGRAVPAVDVALRIARALGCRVEDLFDSPGDPSDIDVELTGEPATPRLALIHAWGRWVGLPLPRAGLHTTADALVVKTHGRRATVAPLRAPEASRENLALMGCAAGLGLLADHLHSRRGAGRFLWLPSSSGAALRALASSQTHIAGVHSTPTKEGADPNLDAVRRLAWREAVVLVTMARWEMGLLSRSEDRRFSSVADIAAPGVRLVAREKGAGAHQFLERELRTAGLRVSAIRPTLTVTGHLDVAHAIAMAAADVGVATRDAALAHGLHFVPLTEERYDLVIPRSLLTDPRVERLLDALVSRANRQELASLGYDMASAGARVAEVEVA